jgi:hypothetical protein
MKSPLAKAAKCPAEDSNSALSGRSLANLPDSFLQSTSTRINSYAVESLVHHQSPDKREHRVRSRSAK